MSDFSEKHGNFKSTMKKVKILFWLLALLFVRNWACPRTDNIFVKFYHQRDLEPEDYFDGTFVEGKGVNKSS